MTFVRALKTNMSDRWRGGIIVGRHVEWKCSCPGFHASPDAARECAKAELYRQIGK